jgi:hypothetical protein
VAPPERSSKSAIGAPSCLPYAPTRLTVAIGASSWQMIVLVSGAVLPLTVQRRHEAGVARRRTIASVAGCRSTVLSRALAGLMGVPPIRWRDAMHRRPLPMFGICNPLFAIRKIDRGLFTFSSRRPVGAHLRGHARRGVRDAEVVRTLDVDVPSLYVRIPRSEIAK